jgi:hypothetical protein
MNIQQSSIEAAVLISATLEATIFKPRQPFTLSFLFFPAQHLQQAQHRKLPSDSSSMQLQHGHTT